MKRVQIVKVIEVVNSQSRPYVVMGEDLEVYYCKFPVGNCDIFDLYYEAVCKEIGDILGIPIPEACLMELHPEPFMSSFPALNLSMIGFGSKEIKPNQLLSAKTDFINNKHDFNRISNPEDLVRIGIFDLHFKNMDRNDANFNLIMSTGIEDASKIYAIDHVQCFGGNAYKQILQPMPESSIGANILRTDYGTAVCRYLGKDALKEILADYCTTFNNEIESIEGVFHTDVTAWNTDVESKVRLMKFVLDSRRNESVRQAMKAFFAYF